MTARLTAREIGIDAGGTAWRIRSLIAMGHDSTRIARALRVSPSLVQSLAAGKTKTVTPSFRDVVCQLWDAWWDRTPPQRTAAERRAAASARRMARRKNWPCPLGLDEPDPTTGDPGMDAPGYRPYRNWRPATGIGVAPDFIPASNPQTYLETA